MQKLFRSGLILFCALFCACQDSSTTSSSDSEASKNAAPAALPDAAAMVKKLITQDGAKDFVAEMRMTSESTDGKSQQVEVRLQRKYSDAGASTFMTVLSPKEDSDKAILAIENNDKPTEAFSYLAGLKKLAKLDSSRPLGFRGAKVTVQELLGMELGQYSHDSGERVTVDGQSLIKIKFEAKKDLNLAFPSIVGYFNEKDQAPARFELIGDNGEVSKKLIIQEVKPIQNRQTITKVAIEDEAQKLKLTMETRKIEYDRGLPDKIFTEQHLKGFITEASTKRNSAN
jgi:outer membrane lipoprotein-sorting protein